MTLAVRIGNSDDTCSDLATVIIPAVRVDNSDLNCGQGWLLSAYLQSGLVTSVEIEM